MNIIESLIQQVYQTSAIEWLATISGFLCVYLASKQHILNWPISLISVSCYLFIFDQHKLYGDATLQLYFFATGIYGWYHWNKGNLGTTKTISSLKIKEFIFILLAILFLSGAMGYILDNFTDSDVPYIDGFCTAMSLVAQFLMTRKILQTWILWIVVDICYIPLYLSKGLYLTTILYIAFTIIAAQGWIQWKKSYQNID